MISIPDLTSYLDLDSQSAADDVALRDLERRAVAIVEQETGRHFGPNETFVEILVGHGTQELYLNEIPAAITTLEERAQVGDSWTAITDFELRGSRLIRTAGNAFTAGYEYRATYDFGYAAGEEPGAIRQLVMKLVKREWDVRSRPAGVQSEQVGPEKVTYADSSPDPDLEGLVRETVAAWRWPRVA